jgi:hypothetical protein
MIQRVINLTMILLLLCPGISLAVGVVDLPQTGQTACYDTAGALMDCAGTRQDGQVRAGVPWPNPRFSEGVGSEAECVTDNLTGLMWSKDANLAGGPKNWDDAIDFANVTLCGYSDWRLPNVNELESLVDAAQTNPVLPSGHPFINVQPDRYWSSTTGSFDTAYAWFVNLAYGSVDSSNKAAGLLYLWPVRTGQAAADAQVWRTGQTVSYRTGDDGDLKRGASWPSPRFTVTGQCVIDRVTGLIWSKDADPAGSHKTWQQSLDYINSLTLCGHSDWRLPNRKELMSLADRSRQSPALPANHPFVNVPDQYPWSSTTYSASKSRAWLLSMKYGNIASSVKSANSFSVWPVRTGNVGASVVWPVITMTPASGLPGAAFVQSGTGFTPGASATIHFRKSDNSEYQERIVPVDGSGNFQVTYFTPSDLKAGVYTWWAVDDLTSTKSNDLGYTVEGPIIALEAGWNFISFAKAPRDPSAEAVFSDISSNVVVVWGYDNQGKTWLKWKPSAPGSSLSSLDFGKGFWVYADASASLALNVADVSPTVQLYEGWNLVGYAGTDGKDITNGLGPGMDGLWAILWNWTGGQWYAKHASTGDLPFPLLNVLHQGRAYLIRMKWMVEWRQ